MNEEFKLPSYSEIPSVGLYLDQTSKYINEALNDLPECSITNSMISNYVKKHLIANPVRKQYGREQIAHLIFIAVTKSTLSLDDIDGLFRLQEEKYECEKAYMYFRERFDEALNRRELRKDHKEKRKEVILLDNIVATVAGNIRLHEMLRDTLEENVPN